MTAQPQKHAQKDTMSLNELRAEIDAIDTNLHDLLIRRSEIVSEIGAAKAAEKGNTPQTDGQDGQSHVRPEREMDILRTLLNRHKGPLSAVVIARIWRELVTAMAQLQGDFAVAVAAPTRSVGYWDLARDYFGTGTPMTLSNNTAEAVRQLKSDSVTFAVLPAPVWRDNAPWWPLLWSQAGAELHMIARLPIVVNEGAALENLSSVVVAHRDRVPTSPDVHYVALSSAMRQSPHDLIEIFKTVDLPANLLSIGKNPGSGDPWLHLMEITGHISDDIAAQVVTNSKGKLTEARRLGGYLMRPALPMG